MKTKYLVWRHHKVIFTGTLTQVKKFLIATGEFDYYKRQVKRCKYGRCKNYNRREINFWCGMTEYCTIRPLDRRSKSES